MINKFLISIAETILNSLTVAIVLGALIAGYFGFKSYREQKTWENIEEKYFKNGIEGLISYLNYIRSTIEHNYSQFLIILKYFRDFNENLFLDWFKLFRANNPITILSAKIPDSFIVTSSLFDNEHFNNLCIGIFAEALTINDLYISDLRIGLEIFTITDPLKRVKTKEEVINIFRDNANEKYRHFNKDLGVYKIIEVLENILFELRKLNINSYKTLDKIKDNKQIKKLLNELEEVKLPETK